MERTISATEASVKYDEVTQIITDQGQAIIIEQDGAPCAVMPPYDQYVHMKELHERAWRDWQAQLAELHSKIRAELGDSILPSSVDIIRAMREERDQQLNARH